jgi:DNA-binding NtrC family response regulator
MGGSSPIRKCLVVENDVDICYVVCNLLAGMCEGKVAQGIRVALTSLSEESFDAILLDLKCSDQSRDQSKSQIRGIRPALVGRVLVITGEVRSPDILATIERQWQRHVSPRHVTSRLLTALRTLCQLKWTSAIDFESCGKPTD